MKEERDDGLSEDFAVAPEDDGESIDWLGHFTTDAPPLILNFYRPSGVQQVQLTQEMFAKRLSAVLGESVVAKLPTGLMSAFFAMAVQHRQQYDAYDNFRKALRGAEFTKTLRFVQKEHERLRLISCALTIQQPPSLPRQLRVPRQMFEWDEVWMGSLIELVRRILAQLRECEDTLAKQQQYWLNLGRTNVETHLLDVALSTIVTQLKEHNVRFDRYWMLVAYAHATSLVPYLKSSDRDATVAAMKMRIARGRKSKNKKAMLGLFLAQIVQNR